MTTTKGKTAGMKARPGAVIHDMTKNKAKEEAMDKKGGKPTATEVKLEKLIGENA